MAIVIGHRGARALAPENTLRAIRVAKKCGADFVEVDVRLSLDGYLVIIHDESVDRTTDGSGEVGKLSFSELRELDAGLGEKIPTLEEVMLLAKKLDLGIIVEMKEEGIEEQVALGVEGNKAIISSFYHTSLKEIKELGAVRTGIIISSLPVKPVELALWADADAIFPKRSNPNLFKKAHRHGIEVYPWTIDRDDEARWLIGIGADGIVTDNPSIMRKVADLPIKRTGRENCEYYPCHFEGQDCTHCFCPLYPCKDPTLGKFIRSSRKKRVWSCVECKLVHKPDVARYLSEHPDATTDELKSIDCGGTYASG